MQTKHIQKYIENNKDKNICVIYRHLTGGKWSFTLKRYGLPVYNKDIDHFMLIGYIEKELGYAWLIPDDEVVRGEKCRDKGSIAITNRPEYLSKFKKFEITGRLIERNADVQSGNIYEKGSLGYFLVLAKKDGFDNIKDWNEWRKNNEKMPDYTKIDKEKSEKVAKNSGCKDRKEYLDKCAQRLGFKDNKDRRRDIVKEWSWNKGIHVPISENKDCQSWFGVFIGEGIFEKFLLTIFEYVKSTDYNDNGIDFFCKNPRQEFIDKYPQFKLVINKEYRIQLRMRCLRHRTKWSGWDFPIYYNRTSELFILAAWNDRDNLELQHIWIFHRDDIVREKKFWNRSSITITNDPKKLLEFQKYELIHELKKLKELCKESEEK